MDISSGVSNMAASKFRKLCNAVGHAALFFVLVTGIGGFAANNSSFLHPYGPVAFDQRSLFFEVIAWMLIVIVPVFVLVPLFAWRYRRKNAAAKYNPQWDFSWPLEFLIWGVPIAIVGVLSFLIVTKTIRLDPYAALPSSQPPLEIQVVGLDWKWLFIYPGQHIATVGIVALPVNRPVHFRLTSDTVMQSFFIPALGSQIYAMGGMVTQLNLMADRPGHVMGENTQFNGTGFQNQKFIAAAMAPKDFSTWVAKVRSSGRVLNDATYRQLAKKSTPQQVHAELGTGQMPASTVYFSSVIAHLFDNIVDKYRTSPEQRTKSKAQGTTR